MKRLLILATVFGVPAATIAQTTSLDCLPPIFPSGFVTDDLLDDFEDEIRAEYSQYFDASQRYLNCLDAAKATAQAEINEALDGFRATIPHN